MGIMRIGIMRRCDFLILSFLALWLLGWVAFAWPAVQDDPFIHLRYADNLYLRHTVSYNSLEPSYGASSLLYIGLLAVLRAFFASPDLAHATSVAFHLLLFAGVTALFWVHLSRASQQVRLLGFLLLGLLVVPSAVRWLEDGMETGLVLCATSLICLLVFRETRAASRAALAYLALLSLGFFTVLLDCWPCKSVGPKKKAHAEERQGTSSFGAWQMSIYKLHPRRISLGVVPSRPLIFLPPVYCNIFIGRRCCAKYAIVSYIVHSLWR
jgi:hypothetical protein